MKKIYVFGLLFAAALVSKGTCAYAQEDLSDRYAWRLDSVVYSYPLMNGENEEYGRPDSIVFWTKYQPADLNPANEVNKARMSS